MSGANTTGTTGTTGRRRAAAKPTPEVTPPTPQPEAKVKQPRHQEKVGRVVSDKMQKTIVVAVESLKRHPIYKRTYKSTARFKAHDETNDARLNDIVRIEETRPLSKDKRWRLVEIIKRGVQTTPVAEVVAELDPALLDGDVDEDEE
jgi:small subunit ribosomal protein S17